MAFAGAYAPAAAAATGASMRDFRVLAALGKGSYGSVSKAERLTDGCIYAIKEVNIRRLSARERCVGSGSRRAPTAARDAQTARAAAANPTRARRRRHHLRRRRRRLSAAL